MQVGARVLTPITVKAPHGTASNSGRMSLPHLDLPSTLALGLYYYFYFDKWCQYISSGRMEVWVNFLNLYSAIWWLAYC